MWSEQPDPVAHRRAVAAMSSLLPPPAPGFRSRSLALEGTPSPEQVAQLLHSAPGFVWLDGANGRHLLFRDPIAVLTCSGSEAIVSTSTRTIRFASTSLNLLHAALEAWWGPRGAMLVGFLSYEVASELEPIDVASSGAFLPRLHFALYDYALVCESSCWTLLGTDAWRGAAGLPLPPETESALLRRAAESVLPPENPPASFSSGLAHVEPGDLSFCRSVERVVAEIYRGDFFQTNLCRRFEAPFAPHLAWPFYRRMRAVSPPEYGAFLRLEDGRSLLSISPELFLKVQGSIVESRPIKGTRRRGQTEEEDRALAHDLQSSPKDRAELAMIVDVVRNDLSRVCVPGSVQVAEHAALLTLPTLHHTCSRVTGLLQPGLGPVDLLRACFPAASITGAPKIAAMRAAAREEGSARGPCMGSIGWLSLDGRLELSVAIRTAFTGSDRIVYAAGCGITADSIPLSELRESEAKAAAFLQSLGFATRLDAGTAP